MAGTTIALTRRAEASASPLPESAVTQWTNLVGLACVVSALFLAVIGDVPVAAAASLMLAAYALPIMVLDIALGRVHRRASTGLDWGRVAARDSGRVMTKIVGLAATLVAVAAVHALTGFYSRDHMQIAGRFVLLWSPILVPAVIAYVAMIDRVMREPRDGYWQVGRIVLGRWQDIDRGEIKAHALAWTVKGFFLPIMIVYLLQIIGRLQGMAATAMSIDPVTIVSVLTNAAIALELTVVCVGYTCTLRLFDSHIRSTNPFLLGWLVTLAVYEPFNGVISGRIFIYSDSYQWFHWLADSWMLIPWGAAIVVTFFTWLWATAIYGLRWSNLTNRGIITNGPYRFTKHPDYVSKVAFFWLVNVPFVSLAGPWDGLRGAIAMIAVSLIYFGRARMEEKHLSEEPAYRDYALAMNRRSIFAAFGRMIPRLRYLQPAR